MDSAHLNSTLKSERTEYNKINIHQMNQTEINTLKSPVNGCPTVPISINNQMTNVNDYTNLETIKKRVAMGVSTTESTQM